MQTYPYDDPALRKLPTGFWGKYVSTNETAGALTMYQEPHTLSEVERNGCQAVHAAVASHTFRVNYKT